MKIFDIKWDTDGEDVDLPTEMDVPDDLDEDEITDYLSDETGFCVYSWEEEVRLCVSSIMQH